MNLCYLGAPRERIRSSNIAPIIRSACYYGFLLLGLFCIPRVESTSATPTDTTVASHSDAVSTSYPYVLCPLGQDVTPLEYNASADQWIIVPRPTTTSIEAKPCWCITYQSRYPAFCPAAYDTCRIDSVDLNVTCFNVRGNDMETGGNGAGNGRSSMEWVMPFLGPFVVLVYITLAMSCCCSRSGAAAGHYVYSCIIVGCCCFGGDDDGDGRWNRHQRYEQFLQQYLDRAQQSDSEWVRWLLHQGVARERMLLRARGQTDPMLAPTRLELKTKRYYHSHSTPPPTTATNDYVRNTTASTFCTMEGVTPVPGCRDGSGEQGRINNCDLVAHDNYDVEAQQEELGSSNNNNKCVEEAVLVHDNHVGHEIDSLFDDDDEILCAICMSEVEEGDRVGDLICQHLFHVECLKQWLKKKNECPMCSRKDIAMRKA